MSQWISIYSFPLSKDLGALARFIQRYQLPLRITEEKNQQLLLCPDAGLAEMLKPLLQRWDSGELDLDQVQMQRIEDGVPVSEATQVSAATTDSQAGATEDNPDKKNSDAVSVLPSFPLDKTPISLLLIALCFFGWFLQVNNLSSGLLIYPDQSGAHPFSQSSLAWHLEQGQWWRLFTPAIVHFSLPHALFNALGIWILGRPIEARSGSVVFILLVLLCALASNLAQYFWQSGVKFGGMSGVVYALVGFALVLQRFQPLWRDIPAGIPAVALVWLLLCALGIVTLLTGVGVANAAHIGGLLSGLVIALVYCALGGARRFAPT
ncbi:rhomboid family intramembrane serine protease [Microbulbifer sp. THAF38]|uniref:rhomboid family intramembrane serine protease n=1 Tax=Microbulbifer sp. THAF38 TaxID=2587856 RepID=UPI0012692C96|nr:rhomboid family intramembrane serine protease [Microbulbifer sp. THAF38]QFT56676.1 Rhomboid protease GlpG [Microbulbifer sp. THAF38]